MLDFSVIICYKETDSSGRRTPDSVLANDLYHQLTQEGFKVFFARITLEDKIGTAYEPYIFAALNSAKVMVVIGTKPEYFNAVWVKNEWSRYLALIKAGANKVLVPAYRDMDPYDLPDEFSYLQAQDMSKLGFMQDLIRGINKIAKTPEPEKPAASAPSAGTGSSSATAPLLMRISIFLEDGEWDLASEYCENVLDIDPMCADAYLGKLMAELQVNTENQLSGLDYDFANNVNYKRAVRYGCVRIESLSRRFTMPEKKEEAPSKPVQQPAPSKELPKINEFLPYKTSPIAISYPELNSSWLIVLRENGTLASSDPILISHFNINSWRRIISAAAGEYSAFGLTDQGKVVCAGFDKTIPPIVAKWTDIVAISAKKDFVLGLKSNGKVVGAGLSDKLDSVVSSWTDIVSIAAGVYHAVGLKKDGTVVVAMDRASNNEDLVSEWKDIVAIEAGDKLTVGLRADGTVVATGNNYYGQCNVSQWRDITAISAGLTHIVGLKKDGTVVSTGKAEFDRGEEEGVYEFLDVSDWTDIVEIVTGGTCTVGRKSDGSFVCKGYDDVFSPFEDRVHFRTHNIAAAARYATADDLIHFESQKLNDILVRKQKFDPKFRQYGLCQYCGGFISGIFSKKCSVCGNPKDY